MLCLHVVLLLLLQIDELMILRFPLREINVDLLVVVTLIFFVEEKAYSVETYHIVITIYFD